MNNAEIIKGIDLAIEGLTTIKKAMMVADGAVAPTEDAPKGKAVAKKEKVQKEEPINPPVEETEGVVTGKFDVEELKKMKYNDFKKLASSLGVKCTGTRDEIMERILALDVTITDDGAEVSEPVEDDKAPSKSDKPAKGKKLGKKEADEPARDEFDEQAEEIAKETDVEEIIASLAEVDIKANKKNAVTLLAKALREGLIELDDDEDEDEDAEEVDSEDAEDVEVEIEADSYFPEYDPNGYNDPEEMTEERAEAIEAKMDEILTAISDETLTQEDIESYIEDNATEAEIDLLGDEYEDDELIKLYMELVKRTIDNEGEEHEPGEAYEVNDKDVCCGHELKYVKKAKKYICSHCGTEYEAD